MPRTSGFCFCLSPGPFLSLSTPLGTLLPACSVGGSPSSFVTPAPGQVRLDLLDLLPLRPSSHLVYVTWCQLPSCLVAHRCSVVTAAAAGIWCWVSAAASPPSGTCFPASCFQTAWAPRSYHSVPGRLSEGSGGGNLPRSFLGSLLTKMQEGIRLSPGGQVARDRSSGVQKVTVEEAIYTRRK